MSKTPICDKAAFDACPHAIGGRVIAAKVVMFSVAEKLELELTELRQQVERMKSCDNCEDNYHDSDFGNECENAGTIGADRQRDVKLCLNRNKCFWRLKDA